MVQIKSSKKISELKRGDKIKVDNLTLEVDDHYVLMEHGKPKNKVNEMAIDVFDKKTDKDYQVRYFEDNLEMSLEFYELQGEIMWVKKDIKKIEW